MSLSRPSSLRMMLIQRLLPAMLVLLLLGAGAGYWVALQTATKAYDRSLLDTALAIAEQTRVVNGVLQVSLTPQAREVLLTDKFDRIFYAVHDSAGNLLEGHPGLPMPSAESLSALRHEGRWYYDGSVEGEPVRLAILERQLGEARVTILAGETRVKRKELLRDILLGMLLPELALGLVAGSIIWFGVRSGLKPLDQMRDELADRSPADLRPVAAKVPKEIEPVAIEINGLLQRLEQALVSQRNFVADAAHQLRTPIAALLAQVEAAQQAQAAGQYDSLQGLQAATRRLAHLVEQLLALARAEPALTQTECPVALDQVIRTVAETYLPTAIRRQIDLGFEVVPVTVAGNDLLLGELLGNLLDNALRHTPQGGEVLVRCGVALGQACLSVEDSGPGIPLAERSRIGERFYRPAGQLGEGCGLGLAIVREIARQHRGRLWIEDADRLGGIRFRVEIPVLP